MKLNRSVFWATAAVLVVGSVATIGCSRSTDGDDDESVGTEQAAAGQPGSVNEDVAQNAGNDLGVEQYRGGSSHGGGAHSGSAHGSVHGGGARGGGFHGGHDGRGHWGGGHWGRGHWGGGHWGGGRWGRWGGGRWVGGRWVDGPYYGWCDDRYYACNRAWW